MNESFRDYIETARTVAIERGLCWDLPVEPDGSVDNEFAWDVTRLCGATPPPVARLNDLGYDEETLAVINKCAGSEVRASSRQPLSTNWQDLIKASVIYQMFVVRNSPGHVVDQIGRPVRVLATCVLLRSRAEPWSVSIDDIRWAIEIAGQVQRSGKLAEMVHGVVKNILDARYLCDQGPFGNRVKPQKETGRRWGANKPTMLPRLEDKKDASKLPEERVLWELVEIVFTKQPRSFLDALRFAQLRVLILTGFRVGEVASIPYDWKREKERIVVNDGSAGVYGAISRSMSVRHFAEKQKGHKQNSIELHEAFQEVPTAFEEIMSGTLDGVARATAPLRERLKRQIETGRMFPEFARDDLVSVFEMYVRLSGNPIYRGDQPPTEWLNEYYQTGDPSVFDRIAMSQRESRSPLRGTFYMYWDRWSKRKDSPRFRTEDGAVADEGRRNYENLFLRIGEVEDFIAHTMPTKMSDTHTLALANGKLPVIELMFLMPKRALAEGRNDGLCDVTRYFSVGRMTSADIITWICSERGGLFQVYSTTDEARKFKLVSHSLRHLQNTTLFAAGISDAVITKRFDRESVSQSYVYDHRVLAKALSAIDLPHAARHLPAKAQTVAKMIAAGRASGPIVNEFKRIQAAEGDERAFQFLSAEADGFHATPYGHCINGFTQEPCPKHLACFQGCTHFVNTGLDRNQEQLVSLLNKAERALAEISKRSGGVGHANQVRSAGVLIANLKATLASARGERPFACGKDLSVQLKSGS